MITINDLSQRERAALRRSLGILRDEESELTKELNDIKRRMMNYDPREGYVRGDEAWELMMQHFEWQGRIFIKAGLHWLNKEYEETFIQLSNVRAKIEQKTRRKLRAVERARALQQRKPVN